MGKNTVEATVWEWYNRGISRVRKEKAMEKIEFGEIIELEDGKEFICFARVEEAGEEYVFLMSNYKPLEVRFARETEVGGELAVEMVSDPGLKQRLFALFQEKFGPKN